MANRRMFSFRIINSTRFLKMPISARLLYYDLGMRADDDGVVEGFNVLKMSGCTEDDLKILVAKDFVKVLNDDLVSYITDWKEHNLIRADRKTDSIYKDLLLQMVDDVKLLEPRQRADLKPKQEDTSEENRQPLDVQWTDEGQTEDRQLSADGPHRLGKVRLGKDSIDKVSIVEVIDKPEEKPQKKKPTTRHKHGEFSHILLSDEELNKLNEEYGEETIKAYIQKMDEYIEQKGKGYKNYNLAIRKWIKRDSEQPQQPQKQGFKDKGKLRFDNFQGREYDYNSLERQLLGWDKD